MHSYGASRMELFAALDARALGDLPAEPYAFATWKRCRIAPDYYIEGRQPRAFTSAARTHDPAYAHAQLPATSCRSDARKDDGGGKEDRPVYDSAVRRGYGGNGELDRAFLGRGARAFPLAPRQHPWALKFMYRLRQLHHTAISIGSYILYMLSRKGHLLIS